MSFFVIIGFWKGEYTKYNDAFEKFPVVETARLLMREMEDADVSDIYEYAKAKDSFIYTDGFPTEIEEIAFMINIWRTEAYPSKRFIRWSIVLNEEDKVIGGIYLFLPAGNDESGRRMDIGYEIAKDYWNKGYASEAIEAISRYALQNMGLVRVQAQIIPENIGSIRACEKAGFENEGTLRNYCNYERNGNVLNTMVMMSRIQEDIKIK